VDVFTRMLIKATGKGYITGLLSEMHLIGIVSLEYADGTLLFLEHGYDSATHLKWLMACFEKLYGMRINYNKSDLTPINFEEVESQTMPRYFVVG
jgi:hypothetical protein